MSKFKIYGKITAVLMISVPAVWLGVQSYNSGVISIDQEDRKDGKILNPSTQSINRYSSTIRNLTMVKTEIDEDKHQLSLILTDHDNGRQVYANNLNMHYLVPLLPYSREKEPDEFDLANLMLAEYARNGIALSYQKSNSEFGVFNSTENVFSSNEEYIYEKGMIMPNENVRPVRFSVTNNCLNPGLWELSAKDTVGEMYHGWFNFPKDKYYEMVRIVNNIDISDWGLIWALRYKKDLSDIEVELERLRKEGPVLVKAKAIVNGEKRLGSYSTQGSRRKSQKGYFTIIRDNKKIKPETLSEMKIGDKFEMHKFISPGIYSSSDVQTVSYDPDWKNVVIRKVKPLTRYPGSEKTPDSAGYIEIKLKKDDESEAIVLGNIPVSLLVFQDDYSIPAYGVGVLPSSELIERRYFRIKDGPLPHYAYQMSKGEDDKWMLMNNHETGLEQIYLRPFEKNNRIYLRVTLVSYERIVDLLELVVEIDGELEQAIRDASKKYNPPMFRVYKDANII
jgi:hypothetical protein